MSEKIRLDVALVNGGHAESREKAKALIMAGIVFVNNQKSDKAGDTVKPDDIIDILKHKQNGLRRQRKLTRING